MKARIARILTIRQNEKYNVARLAEHQRDHSLYLAFAPLEAPTIVVAVIVENAGWGAAAAAPIERRVFDYWLQDLYPSAEDVAATRRGESKAPIGVPRHAQDISLPGSDTLTDFAAPHHGSAM
jgi:penicillin-binding protein 2